MHTENIPVDTSGTVAVPVTITGLSLVLIDIPSSCNASSICSQVLSNRSPAVKNKVPFNSIDVGSNLNSQPSTEKSIFPSGVHSHQTGPDVLVLKYKHYHDNCLELVNSCLFLW